MQAATLSRGSGRPASLYLARSKSISSSNPDLAVAPGSVDDEVSRILANKVGQGALGSPASVAVPPLRQVKALAVGRVEVTETSSQEKADPGRGAGHWPIV